MLIRQMVISDAEQLAGLHKKIFKRTHFSSLFNLRLLKKYFTYLLEHFQYNFALEEDSEIIGYLIAGKKPGIVINKFLKDNSLSIFWVLLFNPDFMLEKIRNMLSKIFISKYDLHEEGISIYSIAIDSEIQHKGIGRQLITYFEDKLREDKISEYTLAVRPDNQRAINFYLRNNFVEIGRNFKSISYKKTI